MRKVKSLLKQTTPLQICSAPFLLSPEFANENNITKSRVALFFYNATVYATVFKYTRNSTGDTTKLQSKRSKKILLQSTKGIESVSVQALSAHISKDCGQCTSHSTLVAKFKLKQQQFWSISTWSSYD